MADRYGLCGVLPQMRWGVTATRRGRAHFAKPAKGFLLDYAVPGLGKALRFA